MTLVTATIEDVGRVSDNSTWVFYSPVRESSTEDSIITSKRVRRSPVDGELSVTLDPGSATAIDPHGTTYNIDVPDSGTADLWDLIAAAVAFPPGTPASIVGSAVDAWLALNPLDWAQVGDKPTYMAVGSTAAAARNAIGAGTASTKADVGLGSADNTSDATKPVSSAQQAALDGKPALPAQRTSSIAVVQSEVSPTPQRHGAKGDGTTDDTAAMQAFLAAGYTAARVPPGTYCVTAALVVPPTMKHLEMRGAIVKATATISGPMMTYGNTTTRLDDGALIGGRLDCNNLAASGLSVPYFKTVRIYDIEVKNTTSHQFLIGDTAAPSAGVEMKMRGCDGQRDSTGTVPTGSIGVWVRNCTDSYFESSVMVGADISWKNDGGANEFIKCHGWGWASHFPSIIFQDTGSGNGYYACEADTPSLYGWKLDGSATQIVGGQAYYNNNATAPDNAATAVYMTSASPNHRFIGLNVRASSSSHRWARDYESTIDSQHGLASATVLPGSTVNVVASSVSSLIHNFPQARVTTSPSNGDALSVRGAVGNVYFQVSTLSGGPGVFFPNGFQSRWFSDALTTETARMDGSRGSLRLGNYTTTARNALTGLNIGETVYDTTLHKNVTYDGGVWRDGAGTVV